MNEFESHENQPLSKKGKIEILLHEYDTLRDEMLERHTVLTQAIGFGVILLGAISIILWEHTIFCLIAITVASVALLLQWKRFDLDTSATALQVCELEKRINELAGEQLLEWENRWGLFSPEFRFRDKKVRAARKAARKAAKQRPKKKSK